MITVLAVTIAAYGGLVTYMWLFQRKFLFRAEGVRMDPADCGLPEMRTVRITATDGLQLRAWYRPTSTADAPVILYFHGNDAHLGTRAV